MTAILFPGSHRFGAAVLEGGILTAAAGTLPGLALEAPLPVVFHPGAIEVDGGLHFRRDRGIIPDTYKDFSHQAGIFSFQAGKTFLLPVLRRARKLCQCSNHVCVVVRKPGHVYGCHTRSLPRLCSDRSANWMHAGENRKDGSAAVSSSVGRELLVVTGR